LSVDDPTGDWLTSDIDKMLEFLPIIEAPDFQSHIWPDLPDVIENGTRIIQVPYPVYHEVVDWMWKLLYETSAYSDPYAPLPEDQIQDGLPVPVLSTQFSAEYFETATLNQVRRYLVLCTRGERFCDGHIATQFRTGSIQAALMRLKQLRSSM
jgi:hypothetical protein